MPNVWMRRATAIRCDDLRFGCRFRLYVAFRGTDGTLVGWKEDFNMAVRCPVPSQESAYRYADSILDRTKRFSRRRIARHYDRRAFQRRQHGGICGHANHAKRS
ncbi:MAG: Mbeg1-like protein [Bifidobacterium sp.]